MKSLIEISKQAQKNILLYQQQIDEIKAVTKEKKHELQAEISLKVNDSILIKEIETLDKLSKVEKEYKEIIDKITTINTSLLDYSDEANDKVLNSLKSTSQEAISKSDILDDEIKKELIEKTLNKMNNLQDKLEVLIQNGKNKLGDINKKSKNKLDETSNNVENLISKTGDLTENLANKVIY
ncbi:hypothetical protein [Flammeovirga kamogawensis]|uniref:Uncharacterized protein n=1 Tax=Flammeovirga kamogawensis TaxID=373891 RepID=A0ABX8GXP0_9BACT|nr:hypothetical protein [Flammeovirga kamogawensis]MBB6462863.1 ribosomal protein L17 [Flammeovirga kamogawensis]QWG08355.1 hypothetical protein KM029_05315 [Flammeovirga kamogawensis]TRX66652.1 hypothetical protein EO216_00375 [Flammeovirga kamogawensis]